MVVARSTVEVVEAAEEVVVAAANATSAEVLDTTPGTALMLAIAEESAVEVAAVDMEAVSFISALSLCLVIVHFHYFTFSGQRRCYNCGNNGHISRDCTETGSADSKRCYNCQGSGHISRDCPQQQ